MVEIDEQQSASWPVRGGATDDAAQTLAQGRPVGKSGERIDGLPSGLRRQVDWHGHGVPNDAQV